MTWRDWTQVASLLIASGALLFVILTYRRADDWKRSDAGKRVTDDISALTGRVATIENRVENLPTKDDLGKVSDRLITVETKIGDLPTSADVAKLSEGQRGLERGLDTANAGIGIIRNWLMDMKS